MATPPAHKSRPRPLVYCLLDPRGDGSARSGIIAAAAAAGGRGQTGPAGAEAAARTLHAGLDALRLFLDRLKVAASSRARAGALRCVCACLSRARVLSDSRLRCPSGRARSGGADCAVLCAAAAGRPGSIRVGGPEPVPALAPVPGAQVARLHPVPLRTTALILLVGRAGPAGPALLGRSTA